MRIPLIAGNWKLNKTTGESIAFVNELLPLIAGVDGVEIVLCPVFTALATTNWAAKGSKIRLGGQDLFWKESGAYTGEVSGSLLADAGCRYVLVGHSERRRRFGVPEPELAGDAGLVFGDNDVTVNKKLHAALGNALVPIVCVGETLEERRDDRTDIVVADQTRAALLGVPAEAIGGLVFAYEPVWAIGTGETCVAEEANRVCGVIRGAIAAIGGEEAAIAVRVQYGGSVKPDNAADLLTRPHIDGALVGGASLKAASFAEIVKAAPPARS